MNQPMLLVKAEAIQELHDSYQNIIDQQNSHIESILMQFSKTAS